MSRTAYLFPGQGSQKAGMGRDLAERSPAARAVFEEADAALGFPLSTLCFEGPDEKLALTENTQPAILTCSVAALAALREAGAAEPDFVAGHSLGEYSALVAAGAIDFADAVRLVRQRGRYMQEAVPAGVGAMAAVLGLEPARVEEACRETADGDVVSAANLNSPGQTVIAGHAAAVERAAERCRELGAGRAVMLNVSAPFHCALMMPAQRRLAADLARVELRDLRIPLVNNLSAAVVSTADEAREGLEKQVSSPVRWEASMRRLASEGVTRWVEVGPGRVLAGLLRAIDRQWKAVPAGDAAAVEAVVEAVMEKESA